MIRMMNGRPRCMDNQFFKVLINDFTKRLSIPKAFIEEIPEELSGTVILHGPSGNCWPVRLTKTSKGTYLAGGWEAFVKDHSLVEGEYLLFSRVRSMDFNVKIFGKNACEREDAFMVEASSQLKEKIQSPRGDEEKFTTKDTFTYKAAHGSTCQKARKKCQSPRKDAGNIASIIKSMALGEKAKKSAFSFTSQFPYFCIQIKPYSMGAHRYLTLPTSFVKELPQETRMMKLIVNGREWKVKYCFCVGSPCRISVGWTPFTSDNHIKTGDFCVFELVHADILQVHIFRC